MSNAKCHEVKLLSGRTYGALPVIDGHFKPGAAPSFFLCSLSPSHKTTSLGPKHFYMINTTQACRATQGNVKYILGKPYWTHLWS